MSLGWSAAMLVLMRSISTRTRRASSYLGSSLGGGQLCGGPLWMRHLGGRGWRPGGANHMVAINHAGQPGRIWSGLLGHLVRLARASGQACHGGRPGQVTFVDHGAGVNESHCGAGGIEFVHLERRVSHPFSAFPTLSTPILLKPSFTCKWSGIACHAREPVGKHPQTPTCPDSR